MVEGTKKAGGISFEDLGGKEVGGPVPVWAVEPISLTDLGGIRIGQHQPNEPAESKDAAPSGEDVIVDSRE